MEAVALLLAPLAPAAWLLLRWRGRRRRSAEQNALRGMPLPKVVEFDPGNDEWEGFA